MPRRLGMSLVVFPIVLLSLSGCYVNHQQGPIAIRSSGGVLEIAVCEDIDVTRIVGDISYGAGPDNVSYFVNATTPSWPLQAGTIFSVSDIDADFHDVSVAIEPDVERVTGLTIVIEGTNEKMIAAFDTPASFSSDSRWLQSSGGTTDGPC